MVNLRYECKECGCMLWSDYYKRIGKCNECIDPDAKYPDDSEERLHQVLRNCGFVNKDT